MEISTPVGLVLSLILIVGAILLGGSIMAFIDIPSVLIVFGGTIATTMTAETMANVTGAVKFAKNSFSRPSADPAATIEAVVRMSNIARREGVLALENEQIDDEFLAKGIRMAVDGLPQEEIRETLSAEMVGMKQRHARAQDMFKFMAANAPAMGMIGTLIGLVNMLQSLDDPSSIGPAMAVALLTTMYGAVIAFVICGPIAEKLSRWTSEEVANMVVVIEGVDSIVKGYNAAIIQDKLEARIEPGARKAKDEAA